MNDILRRKAVIRKVTYIGVILGLFVVSMFWRGTFRLPVGNPANVTTRDDKGNLKSLSTADQIARLPIKYQSEDLELGEQDASNPEVAGALAQVSLVGVRGFVVAWLWHETTTAQKRGEYHEMERKALLLSKVQPHFITPWVFQAWNIAFNVSVETDKLGDQYYYIARGISLLAEGDKVNTRTHRRGNVEYKVGSPDIRYQLGFYCQNKFSVSDKVATLYSLSQLSLIPPDERNPKLFREPSDGTTLGKVKDKEFRDFCVKYPQLVRRLKTKLNLKSPDQVVAFLEANWRIPARWDVATFQRAGDDRAFPVFPNADPAADRNLTQFLDDLARLETEPPRKDADQNVVGPAGSDGIDIRMVARAWYQHALAVVPPPPVLPDELGGKAVPAMTPQRGEYDQFRYRIPERPALIVVRFAPARAQNYVADRLQKEGWFDESSAWNPDAGYDSDSRWFKTPDGRPAQPPILKPGTHAREEWRKTNEMWVAFGDRNGLNEENLFRQQELTRVAAGKGVAFDREYTDEQLSALGLTRWHLNAPNAIRFYEQNRQITQYQRFRYDSFAETEANLAKARQMMWDADELHLRDQDDLALEKRVQAAVLWRQVYTSSEHRPYYISDLSDTVHENTLAQEAAIADLLVKSRDPVTTARLKAAKDGLAALGPPVLAGADQRITKLVSEDEARTRIALVYALTDPANKDLREEATNKVNEVEEARKKYPDLKPVTLEGTARGLLEGKYSWMKNYADPGQSVEWVRYSVRVNQMQKDGALDPPGGPPPGPGGPPEGGPAPTTMPAPPGPGGR